MLVSAASASSLNEAPPNLNTTDKELRKEVHDAMKALWQKADINKDNRISKLEAQNAKMSICLNHFEAIDQNRDGKVTELEAKVWMKSYTEERTKQDNEVLETVAYDSQQHAGKKQHGMAFKSPEQRQLELLAKTLKPELPKINSSDIQHSVKFSQ